MDKKNWIILGAVVLAAALLLIASGQMKTQVDENTVIITVDGREYTRVPLSQPQTVTVDQGDGMVNVVVVTEKGAYMESSTCKNQQCVHMGEVTVDNWEFRPTQGFIVCLPNKVSVELAVKQ